MFGKIVTWIVEHPAVVAAIEKTVKDVVLPLILKHVNVEPKPNA